MIQRLVRSHAFPMFLLMVLCIVASCGAVAGQETQADTQPTSQAVTEPAPATAPAATAPAEPTADELLAGGIDKILAGNFNDGLAVLQKAGKLAPDNARVTKALRLAEDHARLLARSERQRAKEYADTVERVRYALCAQQYQPELEKDGLGDRLREIIVGRNGDENNLIAAYNKAATVESFEDAYVAEMAEMKKTSIDALRRAAETVPKAVRLLENDKSKYAETFRSLADTLLRRIDENVRIWESLDFNDAASRRNTAALLRDSEVQLAFAVTDLESMTARMPWRIGLAQARLAKQIAIDSDRMTEQDWYKEIVALAEAEGDKAVKEARWYDALAAYYGLNELDKDNENYDLMLKTVERHVRILGIYGKEDEEDRESKESADIEGIDDEEEPYDWREMVQGVDAAMAKNIFARVNVNYVTALDYRKLTGGALLSIKVLAETPQVWNTFTGLKDEKKRNEFIAAVKREMENLNKPGVGYLQPAYALEAVMRASDRTVEIPTEVLAVEFTDGFLSELDKFSSMIWPSEIEDFKKQTTGEFYGIGVQIRKEPGEPLRVESPLPDTPAYKAGLKVGDMIIAVDGERTEHRSVNALIKKIMGEKGTKVTLTIQRPGIVKPFDVTIIRDRIEIRTVKGWRRENSGIWDYMVSPDDKIGYLRVTQFTEQTDSDMRQAINDMKKKGVRSIILDLRFNPGGLLTSATDVSNEFLNGGQIVSTKGRQTQKITHDADSSGVFQDGDLVVLVNQYSASASEIVSGALKDWKRAKIIGMQTYGKGSVQNVIFVRDRAILKLTTAYYRVGKSEHLLHRRNGDKTWGVMPDIPVPITPIQSKLWLDIRRKTDLIQDVDPAELQENLARQYDADIQLQTAVFVLKMLQLQETPAT